MVKPLAQQRSEADSAVFGGDTVIVLDSCLSICT